MISNILSDIKRENFKAIAKDLMNHYCVLKHDSRYDSDIIFRFAEIEFYLYDAGEQNVDEKTYSRYCKSGEWFFHSSGVDIAFDTVRDGDELIRFGGILIRAVEMYKQTEDGQWVQIGVVGGPKLSMYEMFNYTLGMPEIVAIPEGFATDRKLGDPTKRVGFGDNLEQRYVLEGVNWEMPTERVVERKEKDREVYHVMLEKVSRKYNPKVE